MDINRRYMEAVVKAKELRLKNERENKTSIADNNGFGYISDVPKKIAEWSSNYELSNNSTFRMLGDHISDRVISHIQNATADFTESLYEKSIPADDYQFGSGVSNVSVSNSSDCEPCSTGENHLYNFK